MLAFAWIVGCFVVGGFVVVHFTLEAVERLDKRRKAVEFRQVIEEMSSSLPEIIGMTLFWPITLLLFVIGLCLYKLGRI